MATTIAAIAKIANALPTFNATLFIAEEGFE